MKIAALRVLRAFVLRKRRLPWSWAPRNALGSTPKNEKALFSNEEKKIFLRPSCPNNISFCDPRKGDVIIEIDGISLVSNKGESFTKYEKNSAPEKDVNPVDQLRKKLEVSPEQKIPEIDAQQQLYKQQVAQQQPDHPQIDKVTQTLFPNGSPKLSTTPFQINIDQRSPGHFS